ncbi:alpha/beta fold hydrolase [Halobacillus sp. Nhm2S1]|uniref:alpha/beta fold hydrolase n=1 Tax=Halobacillus sp. Nhm2S1 TaxID=2866716 RepID=UPI001C72A161|nr:alpha/beta hydrolase [Halobacillus sp. Nhm2S1]MBX0358533.1 alpha/beta hydrolase [Halobacillus sp. Nhm2S1]
MILHTDVVGDGEPLVFLHTGLQTGKTDFDKQGEYFSSKYQVISPDLRGHGESPSEDSDNYFNQAADDLAATLSSLGINHAHITGCSLGALLAIFLAKRHPEFVRTLAISGVTPLKPENWKSMNEEESKFRLNLLKDEETCAYFDSLHGEGWQRFIHMGQDDDWYPFEAIRSIQTLTMPILYVIGEGLEHEVHGLMDYKEQSDSVHTAVLPFASHLVHTEQPDLYNKTLEVFLSNYES